MTAGPTPPSAANWQPRIARVHEVVAECPDVWTYRLKPETGDFPAFRPGQFNMVYVPGFGEAALSISSAVHELPLLGHTLRTVGDVTGAIARLKIGDQLSWRGPFGNSWPLADLLGKDVVVVAGGIGLAPLRPLIEFVLSNRSDYGLFKLIYGAKSPTALLYQSEFPRWKDAGLEIEVTVDRATPGWLGQIGVVTDLMRPFQGRPQQSRVLTCGPEIMMRFVARESMSLGIDSNHIYVSLERNMMCAMGMCGVCQFGPEFVCKDGPVFAFGRVASYMQLEDL